MMTKIETFDRALNPIVGCGRGCEYCYAKKFCRRIPMMQAGSWIRRNEDSDLTKLFVKNMPFEDRLEIYRKTPVWCEDCFQFKPHTHLERLEQIKPKQLPRSYFVGSIADWNDIKFRKQDLDIIVDKMRECSQHIFVIFSKKPKGFIRFEFPENVWLGTSIQDSGQKERIYDLIGASPDNKKIVSHEPISGPIVTPFPEIDWWIIGAETGRRKDRIIPEWKWISQTFNTRAQSVWIKDNILECFWDNTLDVIPKRVNIKQLPEGYILDKNTENRTRRPYSVRNRRK